VINIFSFNKIKDNNLEMILKWRTRKDITKYMNTDIEYNIENQRKWFEYRPQENI